MRPPARRAPRPGRLGSRSRAARCGRSARPVGSIRDQGSGIGDQGVLAVAGIAHPDRFVQSLRDAGWNVVESMTFADHHRYSHEGRRRHRSRRWQSVGASAVFTTDKDAVRFEALAPSFPLYRVPLIVEFDPPRCAVRVGEGGARVRDAIEYWAVVAVRAIAHAAARRGRARLGIGARPDVLRARSRASARGADQSRAVLSRTGPPASGAPSRARRSRTSARCC